MATGAGTGPGITALATLHPFEARRLELGHIILGMQLTHHHKWGFLIYRTTYADPAAWERYLAFLRERTAWALDIYGRTDDLGPHLEWTIIEDEATLDGASKEAVQARFHAWVAGRSVERDGPGADADEGMLFSSVPRYRLCLCVDAECLASISNELDTRIVAIDRSYGEGGQGEQQLSEEERQALEEEGLSEQDLDTGGVGGCWMWVNVEQWISLYQEAAWRGQWRDLYRLPPQVYEG